METISEACGCGAQTVVFGALLILESCAGVGKFSCRSGIDGGSSHRETAQDLCETNGSVEVTVLGIRISAPSAPLQGAMEPRGRMDADHPPRSVWAVLEGRAVSLRD